MNTNQKSLSPQISQIKGRSGKPKNLYHKGHKGTQRKNLHYRTRAIAESGKPGSFLFLAHSHAKAARE
jgi:hypothetical protein